MGKNLNRNFARNGINLALHDRYEKGIEEQVAEKVIVEYPELKGTLPVGRLTSIAYP